MTTSAVHHRRGRWLIAMVQSPSQAIGADGNDTIETASFAAIAVVAALYHRLSDGTGRWSLYESFSQSESDTLSVRISRSYSRTRHCPMMLDLSSTTHRNAAYTHVRMVLTVVMILPLSSFSSSCLSLCLSQSCSVFALYP